VSQYYYTVASLPALRFEDDPFLDVASFLDMCRVEASEEDMQYIERGSIWLTREEMEVTPGDAVSYRWFQALQDTQIQIAILRGQTLGWEGERYPAVSGSDGILLERSRSILNEENPLKMELALLRRLWQIVEDLEAGHYFDREKLFLYHLKLQIVKRKVRISDSEAGDAEFDRQYATVAESLMEIAI
jgi:hypothetical protein